MIEIIEMVVCDPRFEATTDVKETKHVNLFRRSKPIGIIEHRNVLLKNACCIVANSNSFLMT